MSFPSLKSGSPALLCSTSDDVVPICTSVMTRSVNVPLKALELRICNYVLQTVLLTTFQFDTTWVSILIWVSSRAKSGKHVCLKVSVLKYSIT